MTEGLASLILSLRRRFTLRSALDSELHDNRIKTQHRVKTRPASFAFVADSSPGLPPEMHAGLYAACMLSTLESISWVFRLCVVSSFLPVTSVNPPAVIARVLGPSGS